ncbi:hypothetical protein [Hymenobacter setariae]|nr:hypothetical protein [Hymenobacter setariae]
MRSGIKYKQAWFATSTIFIWMCDVMGFLPMFTTSLACTAM